MRRDMNVKKSSSSTSRKRESVFKAYVLDKLYPSETAPDASAEISRKAISKPTTSSLAGDVKVYTVQLPPEGLQQVQETQAQASSENLYGRLTALSSASESTEDTEGEEQLPRRRVRKKKHRRKASKVGSSLEIFPSSDAPSKVDVNLPEETNQEIQAGILSTPRTTDASSSLTRNQRKKRRKKRAKLGRLQNDRLPGRATEFIYDADDQQGPGRGQADDVGDDLVLVRESAEEVKEFMEAIWRVLSSDGSKYETVISQTPLFQTMMGLLANHQLPGEMVECLKEIKTLLVLQDFHRARLKLTELRGRQSCTSESGNVSLFSILAEYWMTDITSSN